MQFKNPEWQIGINHLSEVVAERLGYKNVPLQCSLYKLLVYGEGGYFLKHQDTEKEDGMVATLVVQLPSTHDGGDLVVYRGGEIKYRHTFGKEEGTAGFLPHYAAHYADAEHALEKVTNGYRLVLVYSICLPPTMLHLQRNFDQTLSEELAGAISNMGPQDTSFALLLEHEYTEKSIAGMGSGALKGIDRARVQALEEANAAVSSDKKLHFFIAQLKHEIHYDTFEGCKEVSRDEYITWYSANEECFGSANTDAKLNFLNPASKRFPNFGDHTLPPKKRGTLATKGILKT